MPPLLHVPCEGFDDGSFIRLWLHEMLRVFGDRLIEDADREKFHTFLMECMQKNFDEAPDGAVLARIRDLDTSTPDFTFNKMRALMFGNFLVPEADGSARRYVELDDLDRLQPVESPQNTSEH